MKKLLKLLVILMLLSSCNKDDDDQDCGCNGEISFTIEDGDEQIGYLFEVTDHSNGNVPYTNFTIWFNEANCGNCMHYFLVCNDSFLTNFGDIPAYPGVEVKFSGQAKELCENPISPADYTYNYITLTEIQPL